MFRNKMLLRATPSSSPSPFSLLPLSLSSSSSIPPLDLDILCCKLSRRWRLACLPQPSHILLVYQRCQSNAASQVVAELVAAFPTVSVGAEEEVSSGLLIAKAVECGLRSVMLDHEWGCVGENTFVDSTLASSEERSNLCAVNVLSKMVKRLVLVTQSNGNMLQAKHLLCRRSPQFNLSQVSSGRSDEYEFLVSPDALQFSRHKISDLASSKMMETFEKGKEVVLEDCNLLTACTTLPSLCEGHVIGFSKVLPSGKCLDMFVELCSLKHGLAIDNNCYIAVQLAYGGRMEKQWFPSSFVLQGSGLHPAPKSIRGLKAMPALESFVEVLKDWDFFGQYHLIIKEQALLNSTRTVPTWEKATTSLTSHITRTDNSEDHDFTCENFIAKDQFFTLDFRTPKPAFQYSSGNKLWNTKIQEIALSLDVGNEDSTTKVVSNVCQSQHTLACRQLASKPLVTKTSCSAQVQMLRPSFSRNKGTDKNKKRSSPKHLDTDNSHKPSHAGPVNSSSASLLKSSHAGPVNSSSESLLKSSHSGPVISTVGLGPKDDPLMISGGGNTQSTGDHVSMMIANQLGVRMQNMVQSSLHGSQNPKKQHEEFLNRSCLEGPAKVQQGNSSEKRDTNRKKNKEGIADGTIRTKAKPEVDKDKLTAKVMNHHKRGELRSLTVADLKCFLSAKKAKVGGTKEVLLQRVTDLLA